MFRLVPDIFPGVIPGFNPGIFRLSLPKPEMAGKRKGKPDNGKEKKPKYHKTAFRVGHLRKIRARKQKKRSDSFLFESGILLNLCNHRRHGFILLQKSLKIHKFTSLAATPRKQPILSKLGHFKHCYTFVKMIKIKEIHMVFIVF